MHNLNKKFNDSLRDSLRVSLRDSLEHSLRDSLEHSLGSISINDSLDKTAQNAQSVKETNDV
jgi:hypothetical protein